MSELSVSSWLSTYPEFEEEVSQGGDGRFGERKKILQMQYF